MRWARISATASWNWGCVQRRFFVPSDREGHYRFDLPGYVAHRLTQAGTGSVESLGLCTYPDAKTAFSVSAAPPMSGSPIMAGKFRRLCLPSNSFAAEIA